MNSTIETLLQHRSIRELKGEALDAEVVETLFKVAMRTATSNGMQRYSIIQITDLKLKTEIAELCHQDYINRAPLLVIFIADCYRNARIAFEQGNKEAMHEHVDKFIEGFTDSNLAAQSMVAAAESLGLGTFYIGSVLNDARKMIQLLSLPKLTMPVLGLAIGIPNQAPNLKPRMQVHHRVFKDKYTTYESYMETFKEYDEEMQTYYDLRNANQRVDAFSKQVLTKFAAQNPLRQAYLKILEEQGFILHV
jgi:FMN reductase (NADPH)